MALVRTDVRDTRIRHLYGEQIASVRVALDSGPVILSGLPGSELEEIAKRAGDNVLPIAPARAAALPGLVHDVAQAVAAEIGVRSTLKLARLLNRQPVVVRLPEGPTLISESGETTDFSWNDIVNALPPEHLIVVQDAHLLTEPWAERALWALRGRAASEPLRVLLLTRPWHEDKLTDSRGPFFGFGKTHKIEQPQTARWRKAYDDRVAPDHLSWLLERTRGLVRPTMKTLDEAVDESSTTPNVMAAWSWLELSSQQEAELAARLARGFHRFGPRLLAAIAAGQPPYAAVPGARPNAIATALRTLRDNDLIYQPAPRRWLIANPLLESSLARQ